MLGGGEKMNCNVAATVSQIPFWHREYQRAEWGPLTGGRLSILRNANVACLCRLFMAMSHVEFKK